MNREEAIKILRIRKEYATLIKENVLQEAIDMAIEALSKMTGKWIEYEPAKVYWNGEEVYAYKQLQQLQANLLPRVSF